jgi:hypothetical protein
MPLGANADLSMRSTVSVPFTATWGAIMLGGIVGVLMLCFLRVLVAFKPVLLALVAPPRRKAAPHVEPPVEKDAPAAPHAAARTVAVAPTGVSRSPAGGPGGNDFRDGLAPIGDYHLVPGLGGWARAVSHHVSGE